MDAKKMAWNILRFLIFLGIGVGILYLVYQNQEAAYQEECIKKGIASDSCSLLTKIWNDFKGANYFWILLVLVAYTISNISRATRWMMLLKSLGYKPRFVNAFFTTIIGYFANLGLPRAGEVVRAGTMAQYERMRVEKVMGTIVADRVVDVLSILIVSGLAFLLEFNKILAFVDQYVNISERIGNSSTLIIVGLSVMLLGLGLFWVFRKQLAEFPLYQKVLKIIEGFGEGIRSILRLEKPWLFVLHSINIWLMYYLMTYLCFFAFEPTAHLTPLAALVVFVFGGWGIVIPSPGGMGSYHFLAQTALQIYGVDGNDGFSWANIAFFSIQLGGNVLLGIIALILLPILNRGYHPEVFDQETTSQTKAESPSNVDS